MINCVRDDEDGDYFFHLSKFMQHHHMLKSHKCKRSRDDKGSEITPWLHKHYDYKNISNRENTIINIYPLISTQLRRKTHTHTHLPKQTHSQYTHKKKHTPTSTYSYLRTLVGTHILWFRRVKTHSGIHKYIITVQLDILAIRTLDGKL